METHSASLYPLIHGAPSPVCAHLLTPKQLTPPLILRLLPFLASNDLFPGPFSYTLALFNETAILMPDKPFLLSSTNFAHQLACNSIGRHFLLDEDDIGS